MSEVERRFSLGLSPRAVQQLREIRARDGDAHADIIVLLQEIRSDPVYCLRLIDEHYTDQYIEVVKPLAKLQRERANIYIVKTFNIGRWRIITGGSLISRQVFILAFLHRSLDYNDSALQEILDTYESLGIPKLGDAR